MDKSDGNAPSLHHLHCSSPGPSHHHISPEHAPAFSLVFLVLPLSLEALFHTAIREILSGGRAKNTTAVFTTLWGFLHTPFVPRRPGTPSLWSHLPPHPPHSTLAHSNMQTLFCLRTFALAVVGTKGRLPQDVPL